MKHVARKSEHDKHIIEGVVRRFGPVSRVMIHQLTDFRRSTISSLVRELLVEGRLAEVGRSDNPLGRKQILLQLNEKYRFIVGIEFDENTVVTGLLDLHPRVQHLIREPANLDAGVEGLVKQLQGSVRKVVQKAGLTHSCLLGIGIADPGFVDTRNGVILTSSTIEFWNQVPLKKMFEEEMKVPTFVESKTRAKTVAERVLGAGEMQDNMIYVDYGAGIGAGVIVDGKLLYGQDCGAGEMGHTHVVENGPACKCGSTGCLEAITSSVAVESRLRQALRNGVTSQAVDLAGGDPTQTRAWHVFQAAQAGDKICSNIVAEVGDYLGLGIANMVNLFNPSVVVLDKRLELAGDAFLDHIHRIVRRQALANSSARLALRFGKLGEEAGILGIGLEVLEKHFEIPALRPPKFMVEAASFPKTPALNQTLTQP